VLQEAVRLSPEGRAALARAENPSAADIGRYLFAWLGDIPAHDLFVAWDRDRIDAILSGTVGDSDEDFLQGYRALHRVFFAPSYSRTLALLTPVLDEAGGRMGFWRVILPRPSWFSNRIKGWKGRIDYDDLPVDLVPDLPFGSIVTKRLRLDAPELMTHLVAGNYHVTDLDYELLTKRRHQAPLRAYEHSRLQLTFVDPAGASLRVSAELAWPRKRGEVEITALEFVTEGDEQLSRRVEAVNPNRLTSASKP
jgi:hypothetical protein